MKKSILWAMLLFSSLVLGLTSCSDDDDNDPVIPPVATPNGAYVLNNGQMGSNSASLVYYDLDNKTTYDAFEAANGISLGDLGQDMIVYGSKMYIAVANSGVIYVTDRDAKILSTIKDDTNKLQPRAFDVYNGKVYVSLFDGYLARIDTTSLTIDKKIQVGLNPEGVKAVNNKIYVANSGGLNYESGDYDNTVSVVDPDLTSKRDITVVINPSQLETDKYGNLYLVSKGNYEDIPNSLQQIDTATDEVTVLEEGRANSIYVYDDKVYILNKVYDKNWNPQSEFFYYDILNKKVVETSFITDGTPIADAASIAIEPASGDFYVSVANGTNNGDVYIFSSEGKLKSKLDTGSAFPMGVWFVKK